MFPSTILFSAEAPTLEVYYTTPGDQRKPIAQAVFLIKNDTIRTFYTMGDSIEDVSYKLQKSVEGKWTDEESVRVCGTGMTFYPLLPGSSLMFTAYAPAVNSAVWRARVFLYTKKDPSSLVELKSKTIKIPKGLLEE